MTEDEMKQALLQLTEVRRRGIDDSLMAHLHQSLTPDAPPRITVKEIFQREEELEAKFEGWHLIWDDSYKSYGIIPKEK